MHMNLFYLFVFISLLVSCSTDVEDESDSFDAAKVCPESGRGTFTDERDGQEYKYTTIGNQVWMAENLKYDAEYSLCLDSYMKSNGEVIQNFCEKFGRFYTLQKNGSFFGKKEDGLIKTVCVKGWHLPSVEEWKILIENVESLNPELISARLKTNDYWFFVGKGSDDCGFSALPAGAYTGDIYGLAYFGTEAIFLTSTVDSSDQIKTIKISDDVTVFNNLPKMSIRCVKD